MAHVLIPLDGSLEHAQVAIREGVKMAHSLNAKVTLLGVIPNLDTSQVRVGCEVEKKNFNDEKSACMAFLEKCKEEFGEEKDKVMTEVIVGHAGVPDEIASYAKAHDVTMIIIGTEGTGLSLKRMLVGSVTKKLLAITNVPTLVVR